MTKFDAAPEYVPPIELFEEAADGVRHETARLVDLARQELRRLQDLDAELEDTVPGDMMSARAARHVCRHRLRAIARQLTIARSELVPITDRRRWRAARRVVEWAREAQAADPPYLEQDAVA